jgi:hypothetical protein
MAPRRRRPGSIIGHGFIHAFGLFWSADEVNWKPGPGHRNEFRLLGRLGKQGRALQVCDFRPQRGIYVLYDDYGPYYVGLTRQTELGSRLRRHLSDYHRGKWDRFSWFGFRRVLKGCLADGTRGLGAVPLYPRADSDSTIGDIEALLIQSLGTQHRGNAMEMRFSAAEHWTQVMLRDYDYYLDRLERPAQSQARKRESRRRRRSTRS